MENEGVVTRKLKELPSINSHRLMPLKEDGWCDYICVDCGVLLLQAMKDRDMYAYSTGDPVSCGEMIMKDALE